MSHHLARLPQRQLIPDGWRPSEAAIDQIEAAYPHHHFDPEEAVDEFVAYAQRKGFTFASAAEADAAFCRNIGALLGRRPKGPVDFGRPVNRNEPPSVVAFILGMR